MDTLLRNYKELLAKVDALCSVIARSFADHIRCRKGCADCCRHLRLFPVEAVALSVQLRKLPGRQADHIRTRAQRSGPQDACPLLENSCCLMYEARPVICRTHGYPLLMDGQEGQRLDFCPRNFQGVETLPGSAVIHLEQLNTMLGAVNSVFVADSAPLFAAGAERPTVAEALLFEL